MACGSMSEVFPFHPRRSVRPGIHVTYSDSSTAMARSLEHDSIIQLWAMGTLATAAHCQVNGHSPKRLPRGRTPEYFLTLS